MCSTTRRVCTRRPGVMPHFAFPKNKLTKIHLNSFLWCHHHKNTCQKVTVCQILNLNKIVHHNWFVIQWCVDGEEACCPAPRTQNSKIADHIWIIYLRLSNWRQGAQLLVDMARCHARCPNKQKKLYHTWTFIHKHVLYYKWRLCSTQRRAATRCISQEQIVLEIFQFFIRKYVLDDKARCCSTHKHKNAPHVFNTCKNTSCTSYSYTFCFLDTSHSAFFACCIFILSDTSMICGQREVVLPGAGYHKTQRLHIIFELFIYD